MDGHNALVIEKNKIARQNEQRMIDEIKKKVLDLLEKKHGKKFLVKAFRLNPANLEIEFYCQCEEEKKTPVFSCISGKDGNVRDNYIDTAMKQKTEDMIIELLREKDIFAVVDIQTPHNNPFDDGYNEESINLYLRKINSLMISIAINAKNTKGMDVLEVLPDILSFCQNKKTISIYELNPKDIAYLNELGQKGKDVSFREMDMFKPINYISKVI